MTYYCERYNGAFDKAACEEGYERFTSIHGVSGWKKDDKFFIWNGNCNPQAEGYASKHLQEVTPPSDFYSTSNHHIRDNNGKLIGTILFAGGSIVGVAVTVAFGIALYGNPLSSIVGVGLIATLLGKQRVESREFFDQAQSTSPTTFIDPILIDLNNDGIISTTSTNDGTYFDHQNDGFAETSAWVFPEDGILAIDKNNDGIINNGSEIFGDNYIKGDGTKATSGFNALKDLDSNNDNIINSQDEAFSQIKILKGDGTILTLQEAGIESINLNTTTKNTIDENGNTLINQGTYTKADGTTGNLGDFNLKVDNVISINFSNQNNYLNMV